MTNHYQTLGLPNFASQSEVQKAFRRLALKYHPDKTGGDAFLESKFKEVNAAYQILSDPHKKAKYDEILIFGQRKPSPPPNYTTSEVKEKPSYSPRKEKQLEYTEFQKVYIKVALATLGLFVFCAIIGNFFSKDLTPKENFINKEQEIYQKANDYLKEENFTQSIKLLDTLELLNIEPSVLLDYRRDFISKLDFQTENLTINKNYSEALKLAIFYKEANEKFYFAINSKDKIRLVNLLFLNSKNIEALKYAEIVSKEGFKKYNDAFEMANLLAHYKAFELSFDILKQHVPDFLLEMQYRFGANYKSVLETGELHPSIIPAMFQYLCLGGFYSDKSMELHQDILRDMIREANHKELFSALYREKFNRLSFKNSELITANKEILEEFNLYTFYAF